MATFEEAKQVKRNHSATLLKQPGVCGVDVQTDAEGEAVIYVHVDTNAADVLARIPTQLEGIPVKCLHTGPFRKQA